MAGIGQKDKKTCRARKTTENRKKQVKKPKSHPTDAEAEMIRRRRELVMRLRVTQGANFRAISKALEKEGPQDETVSTWEPAVVPLRLYRPEFIQFYDGKSDVRHRIESHFQETMRLYSIG